MSGDIVRIQISDDFTKILIGVLGQMQGWPLVILILGFFAYRIYVTWQAGQALRILERAVLTVLTQVAANVGTLTSRLERFAGSIDEILRERRR